MQNTFPCYKCAAINRMGERSCKNCGAIFQYHCPQCRSLLNSGDGTCRICGHTVEWSGPACDRGGQAGKSAGGNLKASGKASWVAPLAGLIVVAALGVVASFAYNSMSEKPTAPAITGNTTVIIKDNIRLPDRTPPVISEVQARSIASNSVEIRWTTDEPSTTQVIWNAQNMTSETTPQKEALVTQHSVELSNLKSKLTYYYRVSSVDSAGNGSVYYQKSFDVGKQPGMIRVDVLAHSMYIDAKPLPAGTKTYIKGQVINNGDVPVKINEIAVSVRFTTPGRGAGELAATLDPYPETINPGGAQKFHVIVPNGTDPVYSVSVRTIGQ